MHKEYTIITLREYANGERAAEYQKAYNEKAKKYIIENFKKYCQEGNTNTKGEIIIIERETKSKIVKFETTDQKGAKK